jgi:hypothetical protein
MRIGEKNKQEMRIGNRCTGIKKGDSDLKRGQAPFSSLRAKRGNLLEMIVIARNELNMSLRGTN